MGLSYLEYTTPLTGPITNVMFILPGTYYPIDGTNYQPGKINITMVIGPVNGVAMFQVR
jgi:hypothetical protein